MFNRAWLAAVAVLMLAGSPALADDKSDCTAGVEAIKAAIAKKPSKPVLARLQKALKTAEQEVIENDWDECVAAVKKARLPRK